jgi:BolA family transcriptional regulator, general stress-responsive regulator
MSENIAEKLQIFKPTFLEILDESHLHAGHVDAKKSGSHFAITIVSDSFVGKSRLERHQMIHEALAAELKTNIHALRIKALTPQE